jgi:protein TonB
VKSDACRYGIWLLVALGVHAALLFGPWGFLRKEAAYHVSDVEGIEVSLVESAPGPPAESAPPATAPPIAVVEPAPVPPAPPVPNPEPAPEPVKPPEKPEPRDEPEKPEPKPRAERLPKPAAAKSAATAPRPRAAAPPSSPQSGATGASAPKGAGISGGTGNSSPGYLSNPHPPYPPESKARREQGIVMLAVSINERGEVTSINVSQSSGFPRLDQAAREGVSHWRFRPARVAGLSVASHLAVPVRFRLSD